MGKHKLELLKEGNPEYYKLIDESNELVDEYNRIMKLVHSFKLPTKRIWKLELPKASLFYRAKADLSAIGRDIPTLATHYLDWNSRAVTFTLKPHYFFSSDPAVDKQVSVIHFTNFLLDRTARLNSDITLLQSNYNLRVSEIENAINFWIAITAWGLSFAGLIISVVGLIISLKH